MGCEPWLSPGRDCARSAARHGVLLGVRVRQLRATGAPQSVVKKNARSAALLHICRLRWCVRKSRILRLLCEGERNGKLKMGKIRLGLIGFAEEAVGGDYGDGGGVVAGSKAEVEALAEEHLRKGGFATEAVDDPWLGGA